MDIKSLYLNAKQTGKPQACQAYKDAIEHASQSNPRDYVLQLEYIIKSKIGLSTLLPFFAKHGLPIPLHETVLEKLEECKEKSNDASYKRMIDHSINELKAYKENYIQCFAMYEYYNEGFDSSSYIHTYYGENKNHVQNRMLLSGMFKKFNEAAIPDLLITANQSDSVNKVVEFLSENTEDMMLNQWVYEACNSIGETADCIKAKTASDIVSKMRDRNKKIYQEAVLTMNGDAFLEYSREELDAISTLIFFKEYQMTWADEIGINKTETMNDIYSLYEEYDSMQFEDVADNILSMMPQAMTERPINTSDKKSGKTALYIKRNHDMANWGEDDEADSADKSNADDKDDDIDYYKRPSASNTSNINNDIEKDDSDEDDSKESNKPTSNNYYYYTYNNSLNKNTNTTNTDSHDSNYKTDDHSRHSHIVNNNGDIAVKAHHNLEREKVNADVKKHEVEMKAKADKEKKPDEPFTSMEMFNLDIPGIDDDLFTESKHYYFDGDKYDKQIKRQWFIRSKDGADNCCISISGYPRPLRGRSGMILLREIGGKWHALIKRKPNGEYEFPGGGWDKGETAEEAAVRECQEETQTKTKDVKRVFTQIQYNPKKSQVSPWVKKNVNNEDDWWYGYYSAFFIGQYDGRYNGKIKDEDYEDTFKWKSLDFIKKKINMPSEMKEIIANYINEITGNFNEYTFNDYCGDVIYEAVDVTGKKFDKGYKAAFNYDNGHMLKITYSLQGCEITNVGVSKPVRDAYAEIIENINRESHRGKKSTMKIRAFIVLLKGLLKHKKRVRERKKFITDFLNKHIGDIGYLDFQAKDCKIISIYDLYEKKEITEEVNVVGVFAARRMESGKRVILSQSDLKKVHELIESNKTKFRVSKYKVGQVDIYPTFMSTYWDNRSDHSIMTLGMKTIENDQEDRQLEGELDNIPDIIGDLEMKGYHIDDEAAMRFLKNYQNENIHDLLTDSYNESIMDSDIDHLSYMNEEAGDADDDKPESDHPVKDTLMDVDRALLKKQQGAKKVVQNVQNVGRAAIKPIKRTSQWINNMLMKARDINETNVKEKMADPHGRSAIFNAIKAAIAAGALAKAGLLFNPIILFLGATRLATKGSREHRLRNEMIGEIKTEISIIDEKIKDADAKGDNKAKYQLMRFKNELNKKLLRVGGAKGWSKAI